MVTPCTCWGARTFCGRYKDKNRDNAGDDDSDVENDDDGDILRSLSVPIQKY